MLFCLVDDLYKACPLRKKAIQTTFTIIFSRYEESYCHNNDNNIGSTNKTPINIFIPSRRHHHLYLPQNDINNIKTTPFLRIHVLSYPKLSLDHAIPLK